MQVRPCYISGGFSVKIILYNDQNLISRTKIRNSEIEKKKKTFRLKDLLFERLRIGFKNVLK